MKFVDFATITLQAGHGGAGCTSFRREKFVPKGGPDGGNGGRGASIILRANRHLSTLLDFQYKRIYKAPRGEHGMGARKTGLSGTDVVLDVPAGTIVRDVSTGAIIADLVTHGDEVQAAHGGRGGRGNAAFVTSTNQAPRTFEPGEDGEEREIELELKLLADVGLVGLPNAGKSTLISVISAARPKIADYPFTTLVPNLGIVRVDTAQSFVVADIPGLIAGAHRGKGLGVQFLRHIERTRVLVFLLDATGEDPANDLRTLLAELKGFNPDLLLKPRLIVFTKIDALPAARVAALRRKRIDRATPLAISAVAGTGVPALVAAIWRMMHRKPATRSRGARKGTA
jgi:GTP-binding protein